MLLCGCRPGYLHPEVTHGLGLGCVETDRCGKGIEPLINPLNGNEREILRLKSGISR